MTWSNEIRMKKYLVISCIVITGTHLQDVQWFTVFLPKTVKLKAIIFKIKKPVMKNSILFNYLNTMIFKNFKIIKYSQFEHID